jgi:biotin carboxyl carrier protein
VKFEVETGRRRRTIEIQRSGNGWAVTVEGRSTRVDLARVDDRWSMLVRRGDPDAAADLSTGSNRLRGASYEIAIEPQGQNQHVVYVDGRAVPVTVLAPGKRRPATDRTASTAGPVAIAAPMPGRVVKVLVAPGDAVTARQGLVVVEAMKMENELRAPRDGTVAEVRTREGAPVDANVVLVVIT